MKFSNQLKLNFNYKIQPTYNGVFFLDNFLT
jgi:hypothetical protein